MFYGTSQQKSGYKMSMATKYGVNESMKALKYCSCGTAVVGTCCCMYNPHQKKGIVSIAPSTHLRVVATLGCQIRAMESGLEKGKVRELSCNLHISEV